MIDFEEMRLHSRIDQNVDADDLEAGKRSLSVGSRGVDDLRVEHQERREGEQSCFGDQTDAVPDIFGIEEFASVFLFELAERSGDGALGGEGIVIFVDVFEELFFPLFY